MARIAGVAFWAVDGRQMAVKGNFTVSPTMYERAGIAGQDRIHGYSENPVVPFVQGDVSLQPGTSVNDVDAVVDATITAELADGRVYVLRNAWRAGRSEINSKDGQYQVRFEGESCEELL
ncbi:phage tail tube protein [Methylobacterium durans]|uniref:Phage tail protein n=1 Tax=Methylobacterium durans TaxID=2202825 RepID=A0A2U8WAK1_9HYPH|nr:phage tail tube protein [Methylobacterium durans]AWN43167.1 phage tail protein [Methylobacterium durans]